MLILDGNIFVLAVVVPLVVVAVVVVVVCEVVVVVFVLSNGLKKMIMISLYWGQFCFLVWKNKSEGEMFE